LIASYIAACAEDHVAHDRHELAGQVREQVRLPGREIADAVAGEQVVDWLVDRAPLSTRSPKRSASSLAWSAIAWITIGRPSGGRADMFVSLGPFMQSASRGSCTQTGKEKWWSRHDRLDARVLQGDQEVAVC